MKTISIHSKKGMHYMNAYERSKATEQVTQTNKEERT